MSDGAKALGIGLLVLLGSHAYQTGALKGLKLPIPDNTPAVVVPNGDGSLAKLVDAASASKLQAFYSAFADVVAAGGCQTTGDFREAQVHAVAVLQNTVSAQGWSAVNKPISDRIAAAIGLEDAPLEPANRASLVSALRSISADFGS